MKKGEDPVFFSMMVKVPCKNIGGYRFHFSCPCCDRSCYKLYWDGGVLGCQNCQELLHPTQSMSADNRWRWKKKKFLQRNEGNEWDMHEKPNGMHGARFKKLWGQWKKLNSLKELLFFSKRAYPIAYAAFQEFKERAPDDWENIGKAEQRSNELHGEYESWLFSETLRRCSKDLPVAYTDIDFDKEPFSVP